MKPQPYSEFTGYDLRRSKEASDSKSQLVAKNVDVLPGFRVRARDGLKKVAVLDANSVGLYAANGNLRALIPAGNSLPGGTSGETFIMYDAIGDGTIYALGSILRLAAVETVGASATTGVHPYVVIERTAGVYEHHWIVDVPVPTAGSPPTPSVDPVSTRVALPFTPGPDIIKMSYKVWATDNINGAVWFSSTVNGPTDWRAVNDAGFLPVLQHVSGSRTITGLGYYENNLVVMFADAIQIWHVDVNPALHALLRVLNGPGTDAPGATENVLGDLFYYSRGGFRSLKTVVYTGQLREGDIGSYIQALTSGMDITTYKPVALWSQSRSQYLCAVGTTVFVFTNSPEAKQKTWSIWNLPVPVEYMVEHQGQLYIRSGVNVYRFEPTQITDDGTDITFEFRSQFLSAVPGVHQQINFIDVVQTGTSQIDFYFDPTDDTNYIEGPSVTDSTLAQEKIYVGVMAPSVSVRFTGTVSASRWTLDSFTLWAQSLKL